MAGKIGLYRCKNGTEIKWRVRWYGNYNPNGEKLKRYSRTFTRKKDAENFQAQKKKELEQGIQRDPSSVTLKGYTALWLRNKTINDELRPATVQLYELTLRRLYGHFGSDTLMRKIDRRAAKAFLAGLSAITARKQALGSWSRHRVLRHCKTLFKEAVRDGVVGRNPFDDMKKPKCTPSKWYSLSAGEFHKLLGFTPKLREKVLYALAYTAGLRASEALALYWTNIDFDKGRVHIENRSATNEYPPFDVKDSDTRIIPLPKLTLSLLTELQLESPDNVPFVLMDKQGCQRIRDKWQKCREQSRPWLNPYWANNALRNFQRRIGWAGIEPRNEELSLHVLRKCCCQNWANTLPMNVVKEFMGHSSIDTTAEFYNKVDDHHYTKATESMDDLLKDAGAETSDLFQTFSDDSATTQDTRKANQKRKSI